MGQSFIDLYIKNELTVFVVLFLYMTVITLPVQIMGLTSTWLISHGKLFMKYEMVKAGGGVTLFQPIYLEDPEVLHEALSKLRASLEKWTERYAIICIVDAGDIYPEPAKKLGRIARKYGAHVFVTNARAKRDNLRNSVAYAKDPEAYRHAEEEIVQGLVREEAIKWAHDNGLLYQFAAFHDSDTVPTTPDDNVIGELLRPFADPKIGGVTTAQRIRNPDTYLLRELDWLEDARNEYSMAAASLVGQVLCLPGRLYMVRSCILVGWMDVLAEEYWTVPVWSWTFPFVRIEKVRAHAGDDRRMTMRVQELGYKTVMNPRATVVTSMPRKRAQVSKVFLRWATSSQWLTVIGTFSCPWFRRLWFAMYQGWILGISVTAVTVFLLGRWLWLTFFGDAPSFLPFITMILVSYAGAILTFGFRQWWHLVRHPKDLPVLVPLVWDVTFWQTLRFRAWFNPARIGVWGSRKGADLKKGDIWFESLEKFESRH